MKRILALLLSICLMTSFAFPALAAPGQTSGAATTLRLESTTGTVQMKNAAGVMLQNTKGARLYNGYTLSTQKSSYAYVSLDQTKAIKLDASTGTSVFQSGKMLELKVLSGQIFFNVTAPLQANESLTIRTSTMVTGVRGTCGWVEMVDRHTTRISLLEGKLDVTSKDPLTNLQRTTTIVGGQIATIVYHGDEQEQIAGTVSEDVTIQDMIEDGVIHDENIIYEDTGLTVEDLREEDVPGSVAVEVKKAPELQQKIDETTDLSVPEIIDDAEERLEEDEEQAEAEDEKIQEAVENLGAEETDPIFEEETPKEPDSDGGSSGGGGTTEPQMTSYTVTRIDMVNGLVEQEMLNVEMGTAYNITAPDWDGYEFDHAEGDALTGTFDGPKEFIFYYNPLPYFGISVSCVDMVRDEEFYIYEIQSMKGETYTVPEETFQGYQLDHTEGDALTGTVDGNKTITFYYTQVPIELTDPTTEELQEVMNAPGYSPIYISDANLTNTMDLVEATGGELTREISIDSGEVYIDDGDTMTIEQGGSLYVNSGTSSILTNRGTLEVNGLLDVSNGGTVDNEGEMTGAISVTHGGAVENNGTFTGSVDFWDIPGVFSNTGTCTLTGASGSVGSSSGGNISNSGTMYIEGPVSVSNLSVSAGSVTIEAGGSVTVPADGGMDVSGNGTIVENSGTITNEGILTVGDQAVLVNDGNLDNAANLEMAFGGIIDNSGSMVSGGNITFQGGTGVNGQGTINNTGDLLLANSANGDGTINTVGTLTVSSTYEGELNVTGGTLTVNNLGIVQRVNVPEGEENVLIEVYGGSVMQGIEINNENDVTVNVGEEAGQTGKITGGIAVVNAGAGSSINVGSGGMVLADNYAILMDVPIDVSVTDGGQVSGGVTAIQIASADGNSNISVTNGGQITAGSDSETGVVSCIYVGDYDTSGFNITVDASSTITAICGDGGSAYAIRNYCGDDENGQQAPANIVINGVSYTPTETLTKPQQVTLDVPEGNVSGETADIYILYGMGL